jgi:iron complex transport system substrate-binding protein
VLSLLLVCLLAGSCSHDASRPGTGLRQVQDDSGRTISVSSPVTRYISLAPNITEIIFAIGAGDGLVGRTAYCNYPPAAEKVEVVGDTLKPSIERIIALRPQIVFVSTASQLEAFTRELEAHQIAVYVTDARDLDGVFQSIKRIGVALNKEAEANAVVGEMSERARAVGVKVQNQQPVRVFYQVSDEPLYTIGREAFITDLIKRAGGKSVTADVPGAWPKFSAESAVAAKPDAIILPTGGSMGAANSGVAAPLKNSPAVLNNRVYKINDDHLARPGPRSIDGLEELAHVLHPEAFGK